MERNSSHVVKKGSDLGTLVEFLVKDYDKSVRPGCGGCRNVTSVVYRNSVIPKKPLCLSITREHTHTIRARAHARTHARNIHTAHGTHYMLHTHKGGGGRGEVNLPQR